MKLGACEHSPCQEDAEIVLGAQKRRLCAVHGVEALLALPKVKKKLGDLEMAAFRVGRSDRFKAALVIGIGKGDGEAAYEYALWQPKGAAESLAEIASYVFDLAEAIRNPQGEP